ncbi:MAG: universal stress protein [Nitrospirae bacterium]|nr:universal stress protein [Nitrospirota bacterium]
MKLGKVLLTTDSSPFSSGAEREAINLAKRFNSELYILSVIETNPEFTALAPGILEKLEEKTKNLLSKIRQRAEKEGVKSEIVIREAEEPYKIIIDEAQKRKCEIIIMGRRGRTGITRFLMGSVTARTVGLSPLNVLIVPRAARVEFKNIGVATDASRFSEAATKEAIQLAVETGANLYAIAVITPGAAPERIKESEDTLMRISSECKKKGIRVEKELVKNKPHERIYEAILEYAKRQKADLIVLGSHGRTGIQKLLMGSIAERVIGHADTAVLVVKTAV